MEIHRNNYEAYLLDLVEGRLSPQQEEELRAFLRTHPDCPAALPGHDFTRLEKQEIRCPSRILLKKKIPHDAGEIDPHDFEMLSIARLEGDLPGELLAHHDSLVRNDPEKMKTWEEWTRTRLVVRHVPFPVREQLKKGVWAHRRLRPARWIGVLSAAAAVSLLVVLLKPGLWRFSPVVPVETSQSVVEPPITPMDEMGPSAEAGIPERKKPVKDRLAATPVTLSMKKNQEPPELTGSRKAGGSFSHEKDTLHKKEAVSARSLRTAELTSHSPAVYGEEICDRIRPLYLPPSRVNHSGLTMAQLTELDLEKIFESVAGEEELSFWSIAHSGIAGINRITGTEMSLFAHRDEDGDLSAIEFKSRVFSLTRQVDRED